MDEIRHEQNRQNILGNWDCQKDGGGSAGGGLLSRTVENALQDVKNPWGDSW